MSRRVLIIDDDAAIREVLQVVLEEEGYEVLTAASGTVALEKLERVVCDLIVVDLVMPYMNGYTFLNILQQRGDRLSTLPTIVFTASRTTPQEVEQIEAAGYIYLAKPFEIDELLTQIKELLSIPVTDSRYQQRHLPLTVPRKSA
jgi:two-component system response regulator MtrA